MRHNLSRHDFYPFGGEHDPTATDESHKFTDQERDAETGLDYFIARHYSSNLGRFLQPDEFTGGPIDAFSSNDPLQPGPLPYANITNPQSLNKYTYTYNNPMRFIDPTGHVIEDPQNTTQELEEFKKAGKEEFSDKFVLFVDLNNNVATDKSTQTAGPFGMGPEANVTLTVADKNTLEPVQGDFDIQLVELHIEGDDKAASSSSNSTNRPSNTITDLIIQGMRGTTSTTAQVPLVNGERVQTVFKKKDGTIERRNTNRIKATRTKVVWNGQTLVQQ